MKLEGAFVGKDDGIRIESSTKRNVEYKFIGSIKRIPGMTLFSYNSETGELKEADIEKTVALGFDGNPIYKTKITTEKKCVYFQALNMRSAKKKIQKLLKGGIL